MVFLMNYWFALEIDVKFIQNTKPLYTLTNYCITKDHFMGSVALFVVPYTHTGNFLTWISNGVLLYHCE